ncbi:response regulator [bacterium]|jgi:CheY-like chemotaxis protein|nr:response regulator [bacterium]
MLPFKQIDMELLVLDRPDGDFKNRLQSISKNIGLQFESTKDIDEFQDKVEKYKEKIGIIALNLDLVEERGLEILEWVKLKKYSIEVFTYSKLYHEELVTLLVSYGSFSHFYGPLYDNDIWCSLLKASTHVSLRKNVLYQATNILGMPYEAVELVNSIYSVISKKRSEGSYINEFDLVSMFPKRIALPISKKHRDFTLDKKELPSIFMIVEDNTMRNRLYSLLKDIVRLEVATSGKEALERSRIIRPKMVLVDVRLSDVSGYDVIREIRERHHIPFTLITNKAVTNIDKSLLKQDWVDFINHPFKPPFVLSSLSRLLQLKATIKLFNWVKEEINPT